MQQPPQRMLKPMSAVKPAARVISGQYFTTSDRSMKKNLSPGCYTAESGDISNSQYAGGESLSERESTATCVDTAGTNAVEMLNASLEMCPKRRGINSGKNSNSPRIHLSPAGMSFSADEQIKAEEEEVTSDKRVPEKGGENTTLCPSSSTHTVNWGMSACLRVPFWKNPSHPLASSVAKHETETLAEDEENSGNANVNDTFHIQKPSAVLSREPSVESSRRCLFGNSLAHSQNNNFPQSSTSLQMTGRPSSERIANPQKPDLVTEGKCDGPTANSPMSRYQSKSSGFNHATSTWGPAVKVGCREDRTTNVKRPSVESLIRQHQNKAKQMSHTQNKLMVRSPSPATGGKPPGHLNSLSSTGCDEKQKSDSAFCANSNNVNTVTVSTSSPKSYADAVKSPVVTKVSTWPDARPRPTAVIGHWSNEQTENVMKTPDFGSKDCSKLVENVLKKPFTDEIVPLKPAGEVRQPLRVLSTNIIRCPPDKPSSQCSEITGHDIYKSQLKVRPIVARLRQNRAVLTGPYNVQNRKQQRYMTSQETSAPEISAAPGMQRPNYMQSTFARSQKTLGISRERSFLTKSGNPVVQKTFINRQPLSFSWNKTTAVADAI